MLAEICTGELMALFGGCWTDLQGVERRSCKERLNGCKIWVKSLEQFAGGLPAVARQAPEHANRPERPANRLHVCLMLWN